MSSLATVSQIPSWEPGHVNLAELFRGEPYWKIERGLRTQAAERQVRSNRADDRLILDSFSLSAAECCFLRLPAAQDRTVSLGSPGSCSVHSCLGGGWIVEPQDSTGWFYWIPQPATIRKVSNNGHLCDDQPCQISSLNLSGSYSHLDLSIPGDFCADIVLWKIPFEEKELLHELKQLGALETQGIFLWGSHTTYWKPADLYLHLIFGSVYECRYAWPHQRRICSENDAHSLYVTFNGLRRATGKKIYALFKQQLLLSVLARQGDDGGWHHGEWTEDMEAHLRLHGSAVHLLLDSLEEARDGAVEQALDRATEFTSRHKDETAIGSWLLHDSLELSEAGMKQSPFRWLPSRVLGKSPSNMLVLNTHLDSLVFLDRYQQVTGERRHASLIESAHAAAKTVLNLRPLDWMYAAIFHLLRLTLLPTRAQASLPLPVRVLKRFSWQWLGPNLYRLTARIPRLVMPDGYIERAIAIKGISDAYHSVNVMDIARYWRRFRDDDLSEVIKKAVDFVENNQLRDHWEERDEKRYALGFWAEALYHFYLLAPDWNTLSSLASTMLRLDRLQIGVPPSLLGGNSEAVAVNRQVACPQVTDACLRVADLSHDGHPEFLILNPTETARRLSWQVGICGPLVLKTSTGQSLSWETFPEIAPRDWMFVQGAQASGASV